ncbi:MAG: penicillin-insensitive murein endopeptidase [Actinobacteria bacterium]|nr:penicillin-insensitive murein endopeptidase [Actinomycetota bacterium]
MRRAALAAILALAMVAGEARASPLGQRSPDSVSIGLPWHGRLVHGVRLPAAGTHFFTWDPVLRRAPDRPGRRWGTDRLVRSVLRVVDGYARAHPNAARIGIGDLSRRRGGYFGPKHASHQNGLDVDVYYPRRDRRERSPLLVRQVDRRLAQELVDRFVRAGAEKVFVGPNVGLHGPPDVVQVLPLHDNHLHVRLPPPATTFVNPARGHRVRLPAGWHARVTKEGGATIVTSFSRRRLPASGARRPPPGEAVISIRQRGSSTRERTGIPLRPRRFRLGGLQWREGGHVFTTTVALGRRTRSRTRREAVAVLASIHPTKRVSTLGSTSFLLGRSSQGRAIRAWRLGNPRSRRRVLVVGCIHGDECAGLAVTKLLLRQSRPLAADLWVVDDLNPDGLARGTRQNARGVDLNRNFPSEWRRIGRRGSPQYSGPRPLSEPETRLARSLIERIRPELTIWFHQPQGLVRAWGGSVPAARRYARLAGVPYRSLRWPPGTAPNWQNHRFPGTSSFVVELPPGRLPGAAARRHAAAILRLAQ